MASETETKISTADQILQKLFTNGAGQQADRLLLVKDELHRYAATVSNAQYLGGYSREAVRAILQDALSPSDAEQLDQLRQVGTRTLEVLETYKERHLVPPYLLNAVADLRDALAGVDRVATVQCADCLTWFDKNANHTCRQQVRRNQRSRR